MRLAIRGYGDGVLRFEELIESDDADIAELAMEYTTKLLAYERHMIEIEFIDDPNINERFCRFGTDPDRMVMPIVINDLKKTS